MSSLPYNFGYSVTESYKGRYCDPLYIELFGTYEMIEQGLTGLAHESLNAPNSMVSVIDEHGWTTEVRAHRNLPVLSGCKN